MFDKLKTSSIVYAVGVTIAAILGFLLSGVTQGLEHWSSDLQMAYLSDRKPSQYPRIALILINDKTLENYSYTSPIDRQLIADLVDRLDASGAKVIGLDFIFDRPTEPAKDGNLVASIRKAKTNIVLTALDVRTPLSEARRAFQSDFLLQAGRPTGHAYFDEHDSPLGLSDRVVRLIAKQSDSTLRRSFAELLAAAGGYDARLNSRYISWLLPPSNRSETFLTLSAEQVLGRGNTATALPLDDLLRDRIILLGGDFSDRDRHLTPLSSGSSQRYTGIFIHAQILAQLLDNRSIGPFSTPAELLILVIATCGGIWFGRRDRSGHHHVWIRSVGLVGLILISMTAFMLFDVIFPITLTLLFLLAGTTFGYHSKRLVT